SAPADVRTRSAWLERLFQAVMDDGVQYLSPVEDRWGEIAVYPELMAEYADRLRALIRRVWVDEPPGSHVIGTAICLSCLLEAGRYGDMIELLACAPMKWWHWHRFGAEALARQGAWDAAIAYADGCRVPQGNGRRVPRRRPPTRAGLRSRPHDSRAGRAGFCCQGAEIRGGGRVGRFEALAQRRGL